LNALTPFLFGLALTLTPAGSAEAQTPEPPAKEAPAAAPAPVPTPVPAAVPAPAPKPAPPVAVAPAFSEKVLAVLGPQVEGKARMVFFRPSKFAGGAIGFIVREGEQELGKLRSGNYFILNVEPGKHTFTVHSEATDNTTLEVEAGATYFLAGSISMGFLAGHPHLNAADVAAFEAALPKLEPSKPLK